MKRRLFLQSIGAGLTALSLYPAATLAAGDVFTVGIFPRRNITTTYRIFSPLLDYLEQQLGMKVQLVTAKDFANFWLALKTQQFDMVHFNQYHYMLAHELFGYEAILRNKEFGESTIAGCLIVRKDRGIDSVADLRGKTILFGGGPRAMQSYIAARWLLQNAGLMPGDYEERIALNPPNAVISTYFGQADAAGVGNVVIRLDAVKESIDASKMQYLATTEPAPHLPWAVHPRINDETRKLIQQLMISLSSDAEGQALLDTAKLSGLVPTVNADYDSLRRIVRDVYGEDLGLERWG